MSATPASMPYELRIGVTGHRALEHPEQVAEAVERVLDKISDTLDGAAKDPHGPSGSPKSPLQRFDTFLAQCARPLFALLRSRLPLSASSPTGQQQTPIAWTVVSPLAKGADRIVAWAVLERSPSKLEVVTPLPIDEYRKDFADEADEKEFNDLLANDPHPLVLNADFGQVPLDDPKAARNQAYFDAGSRVVESCELLIAIWDGQSSGGRGGTADIVAHALAQNRIVIWVDPREPQKDARWLTSKPVEGAILEPRSGMWTRPLPTRARQWSLGFHRLAAYNRDAAFDAAAFQRNLESETAEHEKQANEAELPPEAIDCVLERLLPHYVRADQLAATYQELYVTSAKWLFRFSALAVTVVVGQVLFFPHTLWLIVFEIAAMLAAVALLRISRNEAWHEKWLNDRHLAEWLRSTKFTVAFRGAESRQRQEPAKALSFYRGPDHWFIDAFRRPIEVARQSQRTDLPFKALKQFTIDAWIDDQAGWHRRNAESKRRKARYFHRMGLALFAATLVMAVLHITGVGHVEESKGGHHAAAEESSEETLQHDRERSERPSSIAPRVSGEDLWRVMGLLITFLAIICPAWGAAVHSVGNLLDYERIAERSARMGELLDGVVARAKEAEDFDALARAVDEAEAIMAAENHEWLISLSFRGLVLPA